MDKRYLIEISIIIKDKLAWDAFLAILAYEEKKIIEKLRGTKSPDELVRINAEYNLINNLKKLRENALNAEREFNTTSIPN